MGLLWELFQESQIGKRKSVAGDVEARLASLEQEVADLEAFIEQLIAKFESMTGQDLIDDTNENP